jgi:hypothetical protein
LSHKSASRRVEVEKVTQSKKWGFFNFFQLVYKSTYLACTISYRKISEINVKAAKIENISITSMEVDFGE